MVLYLATIYRARAYTRPTRNSGYGYYEQDSERVSVCKHQRREGVVGPAAGSEEEISSSPALGQRGNKSLLTLAQSY